MASSGTTLAISLSAVFLAVQSLSAQPAAPAASSPKEAPMKCSVKREGNRVVIAGLEEAHIGAP